MTTVTGPIAYTAPCWVSVSVTYSVVVPTPLSLMGSGTGCTIPAWFMQASRRLELSTGGRRGSRELLKRIVTSASTGCKSWLFLPTKTPAMLILVLKTILQVISLNLYAAHNGLKTWSRYPHMTLIENT